MFVLSWVLAIVGFILTRYATGSGMYGTSFFAIELFFVCAGIGIFLNTIGIRYAQKIPERNLRLLCIALNASLSIAIAVMCSIR